MAQIYGIHNMWIDQSKFMVYDIVDTWGAGWNQKDISGSSHIAWKSINNEATELVVKW